VWNDLDDKARAAVLVAERFAEGQTVLMELTTTYVRTTCPVAASALLRQEMDAARTAVDKTLAHLHARRRAPSVKELERLAAAQERELSDVVRDLIDDTHSHAVVATAWQDANGGQ